jgi:hypothetical protein
MSGPSHARLASPKLYRWSALQVIDRSWTNRMTTALGSNTEKIFKLVKYWDRPTPDLNITQLEGHIVDCLDFTNLDPTTENDVFLVAEKDGSYHQCRCWFTLRYYLLFYFGYKLPASCLDSHKGLQN